MMDVFGMYSDNTKADNVYNSWISAYSGYDNFSILENYE